MSNVKYTAPEGHHLLHLVELNRALGGSAFVYEQSFLDQKMYENPWYPMIWIDFVTKDAMADEVFSVESLIFEQALYVILYVT